MDGINSVQSYNVHTIAIQVPISDLTRNHNTPDERALRPARSSVSGPRPAVGRRRVFDSDKGKYVGHGPYKQVSRLGNPLFNEVLVPMGEKDMWNARGAARRQAPSRST